MIRSRRRWIWPWVLAAGMLCAVGGSAGAGITVRSFTTTADTNAYAPFSQAQYFDQQTLTKVSPAMADVSDDWTGTNVGGTTNTWHWSARHTPRPPPPSTATASPSPGPGRSAST